MQRYVLRNKEYAKNPYFIEAHTNKEIEDFCMVNYNTCRVELKAFYLLKTMEGETRYTHENLLDWEDFDSYLPLF